MLIELRITPMGGDPHISQEIAEALRILDDSGLRYRLMPTATCIEGDWDEVMPVIQRCHARVRELAPHVITTIVVEDDEDPGSKLDRNVASVEEKLGHAAERDPGERVLTEALEAPSGAPGPEFRRKEEDEDEHGSTVE